MKGNITVFISLILVISLTFVSIICEAIRIRGAKVSSACAIDAALESALARYDARLYEAFGIFGSYYNDSQDFLEYIKNDVELNLYPEIEFTNIHNADFYNIDLIDVAIKEYCLLTDNNGAAFYNQAVNYAKDNLAVELISIMADYVNENADVEDLEEYFRNEEILNEQQIKSGIEEYKQSEGETGEIVEVPELDESPITTVKKIKATGVLSLVVKEGTISASTTELSQCLSGRSLQKGTGNMSMDTDLLNKAFFVQYVGESFDSYTAGTNSNDYLNYKLEYCVAGKDSDRKNLKNVVDRLILIKEATNLVYILTDSGKVSQAKTLATAMVGFTRNLALVEAVKYGILLAWSYAESVVDVRNLLSGGTSALIKSSENWKVELENIVSLNTVLDKPINEKQGLNYNTYLKLLLMFIDTHTLTMRSLDMLEQEMRYLYGKNDYRADNLMVSAEVESICNSKSIFANFRFMSDYLYDTRFKLKTRFSYM